MKKIIIPILFMVVLAMFVSPQSCSSASKKKESVETEKKETNTIDPESIKANNAWRILKKDFDKPSNTMKQYELILTEMRDLKNYYDYCYYLQPKFNSLLNTFLHDERTFYSCIFHTLGKKPLIDEWHTPAKAVFSFYDKSLQP